MLKGILKLFKPTDTARERLTQTLEGLAQQKVHAFAQMEEAKRLMTEAAMATGKGDASAPGLADKALRAQAVAQHRLQSIETMIAATKRELDDELEREKAREIERKRKRAHDLLKERERLSPQLKEQALALAKTYSRMEELRQEAIGMHPAGWERSRRFSDNWGTDWNLRAAVDRTLLLETNGQIGDPRSLGHYTPAEARNKLPSISESVAQSHAQFLSGDPVESTLEAA